MTPKQQARVGVFHIEEAILETLFQADDGYVRLVDIARELGIQSWNESEWIVASIVYRLEEDGRVEARYDAGGRRTGWKLSERERDRRTDS